MTWDKLLSGAFDSGIVPDLAHRILLVGPPGTGKSSFVFNCSTIKRKKIYRLGLFQAQPETELVGQISLANGRTSFVPGPLVRALCEGAVLILDEIDQLSPECRTYIHGALDDFEVSGVTVYGSEYKPRKGFVVIATSNRPATSLPPALLDRFDFILAANSPAQGIIDTLAQWPQLGQSLVASLQPVKDDRVVLTPRRALRLSKVLKSTSCAGFEPAELAAAILGTSSEVANEFLATLS